MPITAEKQSLWTFEEEYKPVSWTLIKVFRFLIFLLCFFIIFFIFMFCFATKPNQVLSSKKQIHQGPWSKVPNRSEWSLNFWLRPVNLQPEKMKTINRRKPETQGHNSSKENERKNQLPFSINQSQFVPSSKFSILCSMNTVHLISRRVERLTLSPVLVVVSVSDRSLEIQCSESFFGCWKWVVFTCEARNSLTVCPSSGN